MLMLEIRFKFKFKFKLKRRTSRRQAPSPWGGRGRERDGQVGNNEEEKMEKKGKEGERRSKLKSAKEQGIVLGALDPNNAKSPQALRPGQELRSGFVFLLGRVDAAPAAPAPEGY